MRYVYLVRGAPNHYKVGVAGDVLSRVRSLQTSNSHKIDIVACKRTPDASGIEKTIHNMLREEKANGGREWFNLTPEQAIDIAIYINEIPFYNVNEVDEIKELMVDCLASGRKINGRMEQLLRNIGHESIPIKQGKKVIQKKINENNIQIKLQYDLDLQAKALELIKKEGRASTSFFQARLGIGYGRATRIMNLFEEQGFVGPPDGAKPRTILL